MNALTLLFAAATLLVSQTLWAAPALSATLTHETTEQGADGVLRHTRFQERFIRQDSQVWVERVLPRWAPAAGQHPGEHHELDIHTAPRLVRAAADGAALLALVDREHRALYAVGTEEYDRTGFSGRWAAEQSLIDPQALTGMKPSARSSKIAGARWLEQIRGGEYTRLLWSDALQFPLVLETGAVNGRYRSITTATLTPDSRQPWAEVRGYAQRELTDLGD